MEYTANQSKPQAPAPFTSYREVLINNTLYRVTSEYLGQFALKDALEDLTVRRIARESLSGAENM